MPYICKEIRSLINKENNYYYGLQSVRIAFIIVIGKKIQNAEEISIFIIILPV
jgi:hypothetical protein